MQGNGTTSPVRDVILLTAQKIQDSFLVDYFILKIERNICHPTDTAAGIGVVACWKGGRFFCWLAMAVSGSP